MTETLIDIINIGSDISRILPLRHAISIPFAAEAGRFYASRATGYLYFATRDGVVRIAEYCDIRRTPFGDNVLFSDVECSLELSGRAKIYSPLRNSNVFTKSDGSVHIFAKSGHICLRSSTTQIPPSSTTQVTPTDSYFAGSVYLTKVGSE